MKHIFFFLFVFFPSIDCDACTSIIVSGKASADGRPFIFKNLDGTDMDVSLIICNGEKYRYVATTNKKNDRVHPNRVSSGYNETGFSIINTVAHLSRDKKDVANNTKILRRALEICKTLKDFETLLDTLPKPLHADSNYGVMDAENGIAYYEVGNNGYVKYDAGDPSVTPNGYLIRTNFGFSGDSAQGKGYGRYMAMEEFVHRIKKNGKIKFEDVIRGATRFLTHGETKVNLYNYEPEHGDIPVFVDFKDFIPRHQTASAQLIQGVRMKEDPKLTTGWTICGFPLTVACIPVWLTNNQTIPRVLSRNEIGHSSLCDAGKELKKRLFPDSKKRRKEDINIAQLINKSGTGILQKIEVIEEAVFRRAKKVQKKVIRGKNADAEIYKFYNWVDVYICKEYKCKFGCELQPPN